MTPQDPFISLHKLYGIGDLQSTPPPYQKSLEILDIFLSTVISYLSNGKLHVPSDTWIQDPAGGNKQVQRDLLIDALGCDEKLKDFAKIMQKN